MMATKSQPQCAKNTGTVYPVHTNMDRALFCFVSINNIYIHFRYHLMLLHWNTITPVSVLSAGLALILSWMNDSIHHNVWVKSLHSQTSTTQPFKFGNV